VGDALRAGEQAVGELLRLEMGVAFDVLEPVRPQVEAWLLDWVAREPLRRADFFETGTGNCRLMSGMCTKLSGTVFVWGKLVAPWAEYVARTLWAGPRSGRSRLSVLPTRLTQQRRIDVKVTEGNLDRALQVMSQVLAAMENEEEEKKLEQLNRGSKAGNEAHCPPPA